MDIAQIAAGLATTLAPYLPTLLEGAEIAAEETLKETVKRIWSHLASAFGSDKGLKLVAEAVHDETPAEEYEPMLKGRLTKYLNANPDIAKAITNLGDDSPVGKMIQRAINGGIIYKGKQIQRGVMAYQEQSADGQGSAILESDQTAEEGSRPKA